MPAKKEDALRTDRRKENGEASVTVHITKELHKQIWEYKKSKANKYGSEIKKIYQMIFELGWKHFKK
jgi:hypothetical protein